MAKKKQTAIKVETVKKTVVKPIENVEKEIVQVTDIKTSASSFNSSIAVKIVNNSTNPLPKYQTEGSVGMDICASAGDTILPGETKMIHTGLYVEIPSGYEMQIRARSGLAYKGIQLANGVGTVDCDFRGECNVLLHNVSKVPFKIIKGDRIAQFVLSIKPKTEWVLVDSLEDSERGTGGFGSTGRA